MPDRCEQKDGTKSLNGLIWTAEALQPELLLLEV
jgi:hypothetical protein